MMRVREWMSAPAVVVSPGLEVLVALDQMTELKIRRLLVEIDGRIAGIVTKGDLEAKLGWDRLAWRRLDRRVADAMTPNPITVGPDDPIEKATGLMLQHKIGGLPVVEDQKIVGIITESDIFRAFAKVMTPQAPSAGR